jgi:hypothetical protein
MSIMQTQLKEDEGARGRDAMGGAVTFLSLIADRALIDQVHRECAQDGNNVKPGVGLKVADTGSMSNPRRPDGKPTNCELILAVQPEARLAFGLEVRRMSSPMTLAVWVCNKGQP